MAPFLFIRLVSLVRKYYLSLKVPFPGIGNDMLFEVPVTITSGINEHLDKSEPQSEPRPYSHRTEPKPEACGSTGTSCRP